MMVLPLALNIFLTPSIVISIVSLEEFSSSPNYYVYFYGFILWPIYHLFLLFLTYVFLKSEGTTLKQLVGPITDRPLQSIITAFGLLAFLVLLSQIVEPAASDIVYGPQTSTRFLEEFKRLPFNIVVYGILVASLTAGICEELVWRGYIQTRLQKVLGGKVLAAVVIQAVLFGLWHSVSLHTIFTAVFGFAAGLIYSHTKRLTPLMIGHWLGDVTTFSAMYFF